MASSDLPTQACALPTRDGPAPVEAREAPLDDEAARGDLVLTLLLAGTVLSGLAVAIAGTDHARARLAAGCVALVLGLGSACRWLRGLHEAWDDDLPRLDVEPSPDGLLTLDERGTVLTINPAACELLGRDRRLLVGRSLSAYLAEAEAKLGARGGLRRRVALELLPGCGKRVLVPCEFGTVRELELQVHEVREGDSCRFVVVVLDAQRASRRRAVG